jgi:predicted nicotinamide N-methyase
MVLPLETEHFLIVSEQEYASKWAGQYIPKLLCCYRTVVYNDRSIRVKEEYGSTIGSHIYDSSIIIVRHLQEYLEDAFDHAHAVNAVDAAGRNADTRSPVTVLELGAGCGLVGIWCAQILSGQLSTEGPTRVTVHTEQDRAAEGQAARVVEQLSADDRPRCSKALDCRYQVHLTDKANQLPLLAYNVQQANAASPPHDAVRTLCIGLDWSSTAQISAYQASLAGAPVDLIVAGDVFYDREIARLFAMLVRQVSTPGVTKVLVAQKLRKNADNIAVALIGETELRAMFGYDSIALVRAEADVLLWSMLVC